MIKNEISLYIYNIVLLKWINKYNSHKMKYNNKHNYTFNQVNHKNKLTIIWNLDYKIWRHYNQNNFILMLQLY